MQQVMLLTIEKLRRDDVRDPDQIASFVLGTSRTMAMPPGAPTRGASGCARRSSRRTPSRRPTPGRRSISIASSTAWRSSWTASGRWCLQTFYAESSAAAVGADLGVSEGNVRVIRHRALAKLRACVLAGRQAS
jgi:RNA polymerase sigma-70 factor (ECF subfamily)